MVSENNKVGSGRKKVVIKGDHKSSKSKMSGHSDKHFSRSSNTVNVSSSVVFFSLVFLFVILLFNLINSFSISSDLSAKLADAREASRPANVSLMILSVDGFCDVCSSIDSVVDTVNSLSSVNVVSSEKIAFPSEKSDRLIKEFDLKRLPAVIVSGEVERSPALKSRLSSARVVDDSLVVEVDNPPFVDSSSGNIEGLVSAVVINKTSCSSCKDVSLLISQLEQGGVVFTNVSVVDADSSRGRSLINSYSLSKLPAIVFSSDLAAYDSIAGLWSQIGSVESDGSFVFRQSPPPYFDVLNNSVRGLVDAFFIVDDSCDDCYDPVPFHLAVLSRMGVFINNSVVLSLNSSEGAAFVDRYNISLVPTVILKGDLEAYPVLVSAWKDVGSVESDGSFVFRAVGLPRQPYKDLSLGEVVRSLN